MNSLNRITPLARAQAWNNIIPNTAYWIMPDGKVWAEDPDVPILPDNRPNLRNSNYLMDLTVYGQDQVLKQSGKVEEMSETQGINPQIYTYFQYLNGVMQKYGHKGLDYVTDQIVRQSGPIQYDDFANVKRVRDAIFFFGKSYRKHILTEIVSQFRTEFLDFKGLRFTPPDNQIWDDMGFYALPDMAKGSYEEAAGALKSQAYMFAVSEDFYYNDYQVNPIADHQRALSAEVDLALNKKIADPINALVASGAPLDWTNLDASNLRTEVDPSVSVMDEVRILTKKERFVPDTLLSPGVLPGRYLKNAWINGDFSDQSNIQRPNALAGILNNPKFLPGMKWAWDDLIEPNADLFFLLFPQEAFKLGLGPRRVAAVTDPISQNRVNLVRYWCSFKIWDFGVATDVYVKRSIAA